MTLPDNAVDQFASTFKEWHYLVGGACIGFVAGIEYCRRHLTDTNCQHT